MKEATIDHIIPLSKGGLDVIENMQLAHDACNQLKADNLPKEFDYEQAERIRPTSSNSSILANE